jgi:hypothetical protein
MDKIIKVSKNEYFTHDSKKTPINSNEFHSVSAGVKGITGLPYSGYFGIILLNSNNIEIGRKIRWITDFNGNEKQYQIIFSPTKETKSIILGYRFNIETPVRSDLEIEVDDLSLISPVISSEKTEKFDEITKYEIPTLPPLMENDENSLEQKIVWLVASPRSGTTWLGTRLLKHPKNIIWHEPLIGLHLGQLRGSMMDAVDYDNPDFKFDRVYDQQGESGEYFFSKLHKNNWIQPLRKLILARVFSQTQTIEKNVIVKDPVGCNGTDILLDALPNSKIIYLIRDGRDEVDSRIDMHSPKSWARLKILSGENRIKAIEYYSKIWVINNRHIYTAFNSHKNELKLLVKYENLLKNTFTELKKIYNFLNIQINDDELQSIIDLYDFNKIPSTERGPGKFNRSGQVGGWRNNFDSQEQDLMNKVMGTMLKHFGYDD